MAALYSKMNALTAPYYPLCMQKKKFLLHQLTKQSWENSLQLWLANEY